MESPYDQQQMSDAVVELIKRNGFKACYIRPLVYRGYDSLGVNPFPCPVDVAIMLWEWGAYFTKDAIEEGLDVKISTWARNAPNTMPSMAKSVANYANSQLIKMEAILEGYAEGIALDTDGNLSEGSGQNIFIVRDGVIHTPPVGSSILSGITRDSVVTIARDLGFDVREQVLPREMLYVADEVFFVGTAVEVTPIKSVDKIKVGRGRRGPITEALQQRFFDIVRGDAADTHGWLQYPGNAPGCCIRHFHPPIKTPGLPGHQNRPAGERRVRVCANSRHGVRVAPAPERCTSTTCSRLPSTAALPTCT